MSMTNRSIAIGASFLVCLLLGSGCSSYYKVRDPQTGRVYYTQDLKQRSGGAVTLKDGKSGDQVTVQNSEVQKINKDRYETARLTSGQNPELEAQQEAARVAEQKAQEQAAEARAAEARAAEQRAAADARAAEAKAAELKSAEAKTATDGQTASAAAAAGTSAEPEAALAGATAAGGAAAAVAAKQAVTPEQLRRNLVAGKDQVDRTLQSLSALTDPTQADLQGAYKRFGQQVDRMKQHAAQTKVDADAMRQTREAYFAKWDQRISQTDNATIRAEADAMRTRLRSGQEKLIADSALAKEAYDPFVADLEDARKFLSGGVTNDAIAVLAPTARKAQENGKLLKQRLDALVADLDAIEGKPTTRPSGASAGSGSGAGANGTISTPSAAPQQDR
jgi:hypothetical protein